MSFRNYYDTSSYGRSRDKGRATTTSVSVDRPTTVTAKYINSTPSYNSSSIPISCSQRTERNDRSGLKDESPISSIANRYAHYGKTEKLAPKYEKKDYSKLTVPSVTGKSRDVSPISTSSKYSYSRPSRHLSPERKITKNFKEKSRDPSPADRDKDIPSKTDKSSSYNSLSSYKLYSRPTNYIRPSSRTETKPAVTVNRYAIASRLSSNYLRSPPTVKRTSVSPVNHTEITPKNETEKSLSPVAAVEETFKTPEEPVKVYFENGCNEDYKEIDTETITVVTRHTSPTPPGSSAYVRSRRADMAKTIEKTVTRSKIRPETADKEVQLDRLEDSNRPCRYSSGGSRASSTNWSYSSSNNYTGYAGRYSTQYPNLRESSSNNSYERTSRSQSTEPPSRENTSVSPHSESSKNKVITNNVIPESNLDDVAVFDQNSTEDMPEIIINVNLKLTRTKSPMATASAEFVSPEVLITNSQLPPQPPKPDGAPKPKKIKVRKSSTDSSSDSSPKKKIVKKRSKSVSSTDSDQGSESSDKNKEHSSSPPKTIQKTSSSSNLQNGSRKLKHSISRESNSPESSITLSTQSSISEDETRSKSNNISRTTADENSLSTDKSSKQSSPLMPQKQDPGTEEAKSFLIRALAPVTNLFKMRLQEPSENSRWLENSTSESTGKDVSNLITESDRSSKSKNIVASNDDNVVKLKHIRHIESGERAWWLEPESEKKTSESRHSNSDKNIPKIIRHVESGEKAWWMETSSETKSDNLIINNNNDKTDSSKPFRNYADDEKPWWLDSSANIPEGVERLTPPRKSSSDSEKSEKFNFFKVRHIESGEQKDWWATSNENSSHSNKLESQTISKSGSDHKRFPGRKIRHVESGERPWWLSSDKNIPEGIEKLPTPPPPQQESDSSDSEEVQVYIPSSHIPPFPLHLPDDEPLGDRRSPEGLETPRENEDYRGRTSPYENNRQCNQRRHLYQKETSRYISRYTDIDDILGTSGQLYSPFMDSILARRTGQIPFDDDECEEIDPTQVRIHDSTAKRPVIKKIRGRNEVASLRDEDQNKPPARTASEQ